MLMAASKALDRDAAPVAFFKEIEVRATHPFAKSVKGWGNLGFGGAGKIKTYCRNFCVRFIPPRRFDI